MRMKLAREPHRLDAKHPILIEELLALVEAGKTDGVAMLIEMLSDLHTKGRNSRYLEKLKKSPIWELKSTTRGGERGGARVYLFIRSDDIAGVVNCEVKADAAPSESKLIVALKVIQAFQGGTDVFKEPE